MTKFYLQLILIFCIPFALLAQSEKGPSLKRSLALTPNFHQWTVDQDGIETTGTQFSTILNAAIPLSSALKIAMSAGFASSGGDLPAIQNMTDLQLTTTYQFPTIGTVLTLQVNIPTGKQTLNMEELPTAIFIGNPVLGYSVPSFGQGFNIAPGVLWAHALRKDMTIGLGASWQFRGGYAPLEDMEILDLSDFNPGNEFLITGGLDYRFNDATALSFDAVVTSFELDKASALDLVKAGSRFTTTLQYQQFFNFNELRVAARYQGQGRNDVLVLGYQNETVPGFMMLATSFRARLSNILWTTVLLELKNYEEIEAAFSGGSVFRIGMQPLLRINRRANLSLLAAYNRGTLKNNLTLVGFEAGAGIAVEF